MRMQIKKKAMQGFTLLECLVVVSIVSVLAGVVAMNVNNSIQAAKAESAVSAVLSQLRLARMEAIAQRRNVTVAVDTSFTGSGNVQHVNIQVLALPGEPTQAVQSIPLPEGSQFVLETGVPDTPLNLGNSAAVSFNGNSGSTPGMQFAPNGSLLDANNSVVNGTIFLGVPGLPNTARAVTVMGGAGNVQRFTWTGSQWER